MFRAVVVTIGLLLAAGLPLRANAADVPQLPARYWGTVKVHGAAGDTDAPAGVVVTAWADGAERGRIVTTEPGRYGGGTALDAKLTVSGDILFGSTVVFYVNGFRADQTVPFQNDHPEEVNLTATMPVTVRADASGDGKVNAVDITKIERIIVRLDPETPGADANRDGKVNALDITKVEMIIAGLP